MNKKILILLLQLLLCFCFGCSQEKLIVKTFYLDSAFSIVPIVTILDNEEKLKDENIKNQLSQITNELDEKFNVFNTNSLISIVNQNAGKKEVFVDEEFIYVLNKALKVSVDTTINNESLYDVSIFSVWKEWNFNENYYQFYNYASPPSIDIINQKLPLVDYKKIEIDSIKKTVFLKEERMAIDLGSIVKGYAADKISIYLKHNNFNNCLIDVGGNIVTLGKNIGTNKNWKVGIQMPYTFSTEIGYIEITSETETLVTSGIYERYIVDKDMKTGEEKVYHHILNPNTGYPEDNDIVSVTIVTQKSIDADALSTAIFLMGVEDGLKYINSKENLDALFITKDKIIIMSESLQQRFHVNEEIYSMGYKIKNNNLL